MNSKELYREIETSSFSCTIYFII